MLVQRAESASGKECTWRHLKSEDISFGAVTGKGSSRGAGRGEVLLADLLKQDSQGSFNQAEWGRTAFAEGRTGQQQQR